MGDVVFVCRDVDACVAEEGCAFAFASLVEFFKLICAVGLQQVRWAEEAEFVKRGPGSIGLVPAALGDFVLVICIVLISGEFFDMAVVIPETLIFDGIVINVTLVTVIIVFIVVIFRTILKAITNVRILCI